MKRKRVLIIFLTLTVIFLASGCDFLTDAVTDEVEVATIEGSVAINRQGEGSAEGVMVNVEGSDEIIEIDNYEGDFTLELETGESYDIYATRKNYENEAGEKLTDLAVSRVQNFYVDSVNPPERFKMLIKPETSLHYSENDNEENLAHRAPELIIEGVQDLDYADEIAEVITISSDRPIYEHHVTLNNSYRKEVRGIYFTNWEIEIENLEVPAPPGGAPQLLAFFIVDKNNNITTEYFQLQMPEVAEGKLPPAPESIELFAQTHNSSLNLLENPQSGEESMGLESLENLKGRETEIQAMPEDTMLLMFLEWVIDNVEADVDYFNIYRSFDGNDFSQVDIVEVEEAYDEDEEEYYLTGAYLDIDTALEPEKEVFYQVTSVNEAGESEEGVVINVTPLPVFEVTLLGPAGEDIGIDPLLAWQGGFAPQPGEEPFAQLLYYFELEVKDKNVSYDTLLDPFYGWKDADLVLPFPEFAVQFSEAFEEDQLRRGTNYQWNLTTAAAIHQANLEEDNKMAESWSFAAGPYYSRPENSSMEFTTKD